MILCVCPLVDSEWWRARPWIQYSSPMSPQPRGVHQNAILFPRWKRLAPLSPPSLHSKNPGTIFIIRSQFYKALQSRAIMPLKISGGKNKSRSRRLLPLECSVDDSHNSNAPFLVHRTRTGWLASKFLTHLFSITIILPSVLPPPGQEWSGFVTFYRITTSRD